jgi:hypothetical protein
VIAFLVLASFFGLPLWLGVIGHEGSTLLVVLNGLRLLWEPTPSESSQAAARSETPRTEIESTDPGTVSSRRP